MARRALRLPLVPVGELRGVIYRSCRIPRGAPLNYIHFFDSDCPLLMTDGCGSRLFIVGGRYRVTARGIRG